MLDALHQPLQSWLAPAVMERVVLFINHVLGSEGAATARLLPHAGRRILIEPVQWPASTVPFSLLPPPPALDARITPAGLIELCPAGDPGPIDLRVRVDVSDPLHLAAQAVAGEVPPLQLDGDAQLAADINWLAANLRWDAAADLERLFGPLPAAQLSQWGRAVAAALRRFLASVRTRSGLDSSAP